ncbi:MAG: c-type cytochrome, partial [Phycisphaerales bacterium]|nr:c-type cytochrome [Phycisphaerales bacterium]
YPFAAVLTDPQELADVAAYIEGLCIPVEHGRYEGSDADRQMATGKVLYEKECRGCHGASGEGFRDKGYPVIAGQHYQYLLRQRSAMASAATPTRRWSESSASTTMLNCSPFQPTSRACGCRAGCARPWHRLGRSVNVRVASATHESPLSLAGEGSGERETVMTFMIGGAWKSYDR